MLDTLNNDYAEGLPLAPQEAEGPKLTRLTEGENAYADWLREKTPESMARVLEAYAPTINSEITRYAGPKPLLRSKAKVLTVSAVKSFNPMSGARLNSWIVTNLKPLARYSIQQRDIHIPEVAARQAAELAAVADRLQDELGRDPTDEELADETGLSVNRVSSVRKKAVAAVTSSSFDETDTEDASAVPGVVEPSKVPFAQEAVYADLSPEDRFIFDSVTGMHGVPKRPGLQVAKLLGISPAAVSQRARAIGEQIAYVVNNG